MPTRVRSWLLVMVLTAATTVVAWSLGVTLSEDVDQPDFLWRPVDVLLDHRAVITVVALVLGGAVSVLFARDRHRGRALPDEVALPVLMIGAVIGIGYSVVTAPTIGANIGGGIVTMGAPFVLVGLAVVAVRAARRHHRAPT